ncbi:helix-turn-helix domain-containing protein [Streptomyces sp. NPDC127092]|uniref:helix-turn-helix domain-containing protein n=1 Tax=Streptomyces sp. NPDC127092 TaxID=3347135 RepID=UPI00365C9B50
MSSRHEAGPHPHPGPVVHDVHPGRPPYVRIGVVPSDDPTRALTLPMMPADDSNAREIMVCGPLRGGLSCTDESRETSGNLVLADSARPVTVSWTAGSALAVLHVPRRLVPYPDDVLLRTTGRAYDATTGVASLLLPLLLSLATAEGPWGAEARQDGLATRLMNQAADLLTSLVAEEAERNARPGGSGRSNADHRAAHEIRRWVNSRLPDPRLRPDAIAEAHHISVRRLYKLFTGENGTISRWILQRRLEECRRELGRAGGTAKVQVVAQRWGFATAAHFSRCFRARYGMSPSEWREHRAEYDTAEVTPLPDTLQETGSAAYLRAPSDHR